MSISFLALTKGDKGFEYSFALASSVTEVLNRYGQYFTILDNL